MEPTKPKGLFMCDCQTEKTVNLTSDQMKKLAIAGAILFAGYKYGSPQVKAAAFAVGATIVAKQVPYVRDVM
jgi:hypothetical protein